MPKTYALEEQLEALTPEQLEELKQELIKSRVEESGGTSVKGLLGRGAIRALSAFGEGAVLGLQGRPISEGSFMRERTKTTTAADEMADEMREFELKERIKQNIRGKTTEPFSITEDFEVPEGYEIAGYDQKGQPMVRKEQLTMGEKASEKAKLEAGRNFEIARNKLRVTAGAFKAMIEAEGAGRVGGFARIFTGASGINPYVKPFEGQLVEAAASLAKLAAPSARVGQEIIAQFKKTLPTKYSTWDEFTSQLRFSLHNAFATAMGQANQSYTEETSNMVDGWVDELVSIEPMTVKEKSAGIENIPAEIKKSGVTSSGMKYIIEE